MKILVATGGSPHSELAIRFSAQMADRAGEPLTILTVNKPGADYAQSEATLKRAIDLLKLPPAKLRTRIRVGHPAEEIIREAEEGRYRLVIVGDRQHGGLVTRFRLGATAERVVEHAPCPVIIVKGQIGPIRRVLLCDSGLKEPALPGRFMAQFGPLLADDRAITVLHVMSQMTAGPGVPDEQLRAGAEQLIEKNTPEGELLERDLQLLARLKVRPRPKVRHGLVVDEILAEARSGAYDLVVIGAHRGQGWRRILLDDLAHQIIQQMDRPVLVVR